MKTTIDITITKDEYGQLRANKNGLCLLKFEWREEEGDWYFWLANNYCPTVFEGREFPMEFFTDACRAMAFVTRWYRGDRLPDGIQIVSGKKFLK